MSSRTRYIVGCSFGKDSLATIIIAKENGEPLDEAVYCEVMFDDGISGEVPEHRDFIYNVGIPTLESWGIKTTVIRGKRTYVSSFTRTIEKGPHAGKINAFPLCGRCCIQHKATELFNRDFRFSDIDAGFRLDDAQISIFDLLGVE